MSNLISPSPRTISGCWSLLGRRALRCAKVASGRAHRRELDCPRECARFRKPDLYTPQYETGARRFDMGGTFELRLLLPAAERAMKQLLAWKVDQVSKTLGAYNRDLAAAAAEVGLDASP